MSRFLDTLHSGRVLLMDGAMGTQLLAAGLRSDENAVAWNLLHPEKVQAVHLAYRQAGAEVLVSNTFLINAANLEDTLKAAGRLPVQLPDLWQTSLQAIAPAEEPVFRLAGLGPVAGRVTDREFNQWSRFPIFDNSLIGADALLLETCSTPRARDAIVRLRDLRTPKPILLSLAFQRETYGDITTRSGHAPEWFAERARSWGVAALGVNCGRDIGRQEIVAIVRRYRTATDLPLFARPNAGTPWQRGKRWIYPHSAREMARWIPDLLEAGVCMIGGCCGTTPGHIRSFRRQVDAWNAQSL